MAVTFVRQQRSMSTAPGLCKQGVTGSSPVGSTTVMSRDTVGRCLGTSLHFRGGFGIPAGDGVTVLAGVKAGALRVAFGQP